jgi:transposase InsO family protein
VEAGDELSLEEIRAFLKASEPVQFQAKNREERYRWVNQVLRSQGYEELKRKDRGVVRRYLEKLTGLSRAQITRLVGQYLAGGEVKPKAYQRHRFRQRYTREDVMLLAEMDNLHQRLSGPATVKLLYRAYYDFGDRRYQRLADLSVAQLYRLRQTARYRQCRLTYQPTRPTAVAIAERRRPEPGGRPGYIRVDTVHQGDLEKVKGVYHINAVDEVTQWQVVGAAENLTEAHLIPVLDAMLAQFPFRIRGFHSDNGSEYINHRLAKHLNKLLIEQTKSRPRHSNDNGLVEAKNGAVIRKHMGYTHIATSHAEPIGVFFRAHLNPYLNFHRPCGVPERRVNRKGKEKRVYRWYATPWEILRQLPDLARHLKEGVTTETLEAQANRQSDHQAAETMQKAKERLFAQIQRRESA